MIHFVYNLQYYLMFEVRWAWRGTHRLPHASPPRIPISGAECRVASCARRRRRPRQVIAAHDASAGPGFLPARLARAARCARSPPVFPPPATAASPPSSPIRRPLPNLRSDPLLCKAQDELPTWRCRSTRRRRASTPPCAGADRRRRGPRLARSRPRAPRRRVVGAAADGVADVPPRARRVGIAVPTALRRLLPPADRARGARARLRSALTSTATTRRTSGTRPTPPPPPRPPRSPPTSR